MSVLPDPPCIKGLIGCSDGDDSSGDTSDTGSSGGLSSDSTSGLDASSPSDDSVLDGTSSASIDALTGLQARLPSFASGSSFLGRSKKSFAQYVLTVKNTGSEPLSDVQVKHGPLPFGATFDPDQSSTECILDGRTAVCTLDLASGASEDLTLTYASSTSLNCAIAKILQSARATIDNLQGSNPVVVSVRCSMKTEEASGVGVGKNNTAQTSGFPLDDTTFNDPGIPTVGYKPYQQYVIPQTGVSDHLYASIVDTQFLSTPVQRTEDSTLPFATIFITSILSLALLIALFAGKMQRKTTREIGSLR